MGFYLMSYNHHSRGDIPMSHEPQWTLHVTTVSQQFVPADLTVLPSIDLGEPRRQTMLPVLVIAR